MRLLDLMISLVVMYWKSDSIISFEINPRKGHRISLTQTLFLPAKRISQWMKLKIVIFGP